MDQSALLKPFKSHLLELKQRLFWCIITLIAATIIGYILHKPILEFLIKPLNQPLFYTSPAGGFDFILKISLFFGTVTSLPIFIYQILKFLEPIIPGRSRLYIFYFLITSCFLVLLGLGFAYFISLPAALSFLAQFGKGSITSLISATEYLSFVIRYMAGFALLFQLPLILLIINKIYPLHAKQLIKKQKFVIILSFLLAAIITPTPDLFNQTLMALPLIFLYQTSVLIIWIVNRQKHSIITIDTRNIIV